MSPRFKTLVKALGVRFAVQNRQTGEILLLNPRGRGGKFLPLPEYAKVKLSALRNQLRRSKGN